MAGHPVSVGVQEEQKHVEATCTVMHGRGLHRTIEPKPLYLSQGYMESPEGKTEEGAVNDEGMVVNGVPTSGPAAAGESRVDEQGRGERESETSK